MALAAPMASAVRRPEVSPFGGHRDERDLAAARRVGQLERHLDAVGVGVVQDELAGPVEGVGAGLERRGAAGSGICFTQTTTFMAIIFVEPGRPPPFGPVTGRLATAARRLAGPPAAADGQCVAEAGR